MAAGSVRGITPEDTKGTEEVEEEEEERAWSVGGSRQIWHSSLSAGWEKGGAEPAAEETVVEEAVAEGSSANEIC